MSTEKILLLDDSVSVRAIAAACLTRAGYQVVVAGSCEEAVLHLNGCDLVIVDFHMPGTNGGNALLALKRALRGVANQPLFFLYTLDKVASRDYRSYGFDGSLINKGDNESLVQQVAIALRFARLRHLNR